MARRNSPSFPIVLANRLVPFFAVAAILALVAGCARFYPRPLSAENTATWFDERSLNSADLKAFMEKHLAKDANPWQAGSWNFEELCLAAFYYQPDLKVARTAWLSAQDAEETAAQRPNPVLNVTPGYNVTTMMASPWIPLGSLDVPIETAGKRRHRRVQAARMAEAARLNFIATAWDVRSLVRSGLLEMLATEKRAKLLDRQLRLQEELVGRLEQQSAAGALAPAETIPARVAEARLNVDIADARRLMADARARLAASIGIPVQALKSIKIAENPFPIAPVAALTSAAARRAALTGRADILAALAEYAASEEGLRLEIAKQYPDVHLAPGYEFDQGDSKWSLGITVELPVLNQNQGPIAEARGRRAQAAAKFGALQAKIIGQVDQAVEAVRISQTHAAALEALAKAQTMATQSLEAQASAGETDQAAVLAAQVELAAAELARLDEQTKFDQAIGALEDAIQRPVDSIPAIFQASNAHEP
ncbi:MAG TPA: TolC family protein [Verrucomicrobiae bacterium]|nr:TolC family protein [Verrucomicrobiae bacterium]